MTMANQHDQHSQPDTDAAVVYKVASPGGRRAFLQALTRGAAVAGTAAAADGCNSPTSPSTAPPTTTSSSTTTTSTTSTVQPVATLAGVVTNETTGQPIGGARVTVVDGPSRNRFATTDGNGYYSLSNITQTSFTARATATNYSNQDKGLTLSRDTRLDFQLRPLPQTTTTSTTTSVSSSCPSYRSCTCNPQTRTYYYPN